MLPHSNYKKKIKILITLLIVGLVLSGLTAFPLESELKFISHHDSFLPVFLQDWLNNIYEAVKDTNTRYSYLSYGTDWLAFAHLVIAVVFVGPLRDPVKNIWVIQFGIISCVMVFFLALVAGPIRHIPVYWRLIDCSFGVGGLLLLVPCYRYIKKITPAILPAKDGN
ncbi:MAG: hypothetical protein KGO82_18780 [Bacteroidota bacterium]|nr:hypothetical protein [Bacteroidota bacterium]